MFESNLCLSDGHADIAGFKFHWNISETPIYTSDCQMIETVSSSHYVEDKTSVGIIFAVQLRTQSHWPIKMALYSSMTPPPDTPWGQLWLAIILRDVTRIWLVKENLLQIWLLSLPECNRLMLTQRFYH